jgi:hypothetical protein
MPSIHEGLSEDKAARMMTALREGQTLRQFAMAKTNKRFIAYCEAHPAYAQEAIPLIEANADAARHRKGHLKNRTHCKLGHPISGDNVL